MGFWGDFGGWFTDNAANIGTAVGAYYGGAGGGLAGRGIGQLLGGDSLDVGGLTEAYLSLLSNQEQQAAYEDAARQAARYADPFYQHRGRFGDILAQTATGERPIQTSPGYQFRYDEGLRALDRKLAAGGHRLSGNRWAELMRYGQDMATQEYENEFARLAMLSGASGAGGYGSAMSGLGPAAQSRGNQYASLGYGMGGKPSLAGGPAINRQYPGGPYGTPGINPTRALGQGQPGGMSFTDLPGMDYASGYAANYAAALAGGAGAEQAGMLAAQTAGFGTEGAALTGEALGYGGAGGTGSSFGSILSGAGTALGYGAAGYGIGQLVGLNEEESTGAGVGAAAGSFFGPVGGLVGGAIGGVLGSAFGEENTAPNFKLGMAPSADYVWEGEMYPNMVELPGDWKLGGQYQEGFEDNFSVETPFGYLGLWGPGSNDLKARQLRPALEAEAAYDRQLAETLSSEEQSYISEQLSGWHPDQDSDTPLSAPELNEESWQKAVRQRRDLINQSLQNFRGRNNG